MSEVLSCCVKGPIPEDKCSFCVVLFTVLVQCVAGGDNYSGTSL